MKRLMITLPAGLFLIFGMMACKKENVQPDESTGVVITDSVAMAFRPANYTFYSLKEGKVLPLSDSATTKWDIAFKFSSIIINGGASGPGNAGVIVKRDGQYESVTSAPETGYAQDTTAARLAINSTFGSPDAWYIYEPVSHAFGPVAGLYFILRTADNHYAKMEVTQVRYHIQPGASYPDSLIYKFRYTYQPDGSRDLSTQ
ncbi:MAG: HmuY family protein [Chitinophagaceae bacterium]|nr:HmuY family protein [Chitinophagaceae bacterium]